ncbi:MAG: L,D-transpeptidase family protein [Nitrospirota bacterium]
MKKYNAIAVLLTAFTFTIMFANGFALERNHDNEIISTQVRAIIKEQISGIRSSRKMRFAGEPIYAFEMLQGLLPQQDNYSKLKQALSQYNKIMEKGGWPVISGGQTLKKGMQDKRIHEIRYRLGVSGDLDSSEIQKGDFFDEALEEAVIRFQKRHGLAADGIAGPAFLKALNVTAEERIRQIELNLERLRWISRDLGRRYVAVNIADFELDVVEDGHIIISMKVIVGKAYWHTPVFSENMTYLVLNPAWNVPKSIAVKEIIPKVRKDPEYLEKNNMKILKGWGKDQIEISPHAINWAELSPGAFTYRFRQEPGPQNPLGRIKFMFPNRFNVYLHDTPYKALYEKKVRTFSHGCIRIEKPIELAEYLLKGDPNWSREKILAAIDEKTTRNIPIPEPIKVYILYLTAWVDEYGVLQFRDDIYGRDRVLYKALRKNPLRD